VEVYKSSYLKVIRVEVDTTALLYIVLDGRMLETQPGDDVKGEFFCMISKARYSQLITLN
jgi:hypothetical protein